jgi:hypothetical protein
MKKISKKLLVCTFLLIIILIISKTTYFATASYEFKYYKKMMYGDYTWDSLTVFSQNLNESDSTCHQYTNTPIEYAGLLRTNNDAIYLKDTLGRDVEVFSFVQDSIITHDNNKVLKYIPFYSVLASRKVDEKKWTINHHEYYFFTFKVLPTINASFVNYYYLKGFGIIGIGAFTPRSYYILEASNHPKFKTLKLDGVTDSIIKLIKLDTMPKSSFY